MLVRVSEADRHLVDGQASIVLECPTAGEGIVQLYNRYPQLLVELMESPIGKGLWLTFLDDVPLLSGEDFEMPVTAESVLRIERLVPTGEHGSFTDILLDVIGPVGQFAKAAASGRWSDLYGGLAWLTPGLRSIAGEEIANYNQAWAMKIGGYIGQVVGLYIPIFGVLGTLSTMAGDMQLSYLDGQNQTFSGLTNSATYSWGEVSNTTASGVSLAIVYGEHRIGGNLLSVYTQNVTQQTVNNIDLAQTLLYEQIGLCEGEIAAISNVLIDGVPAANFNAVDTAPNVDYYRLGAATQEPLPLFGSVENTNSMEYKARNPPVLPSPPVVENHVLTPVYGYITDVDEEAEDDEFSATGTRGFVEGYYAYAGM